MILQDLLFPCFQFFLSLRWLLKMILILLKESLHDEEFYSNQWPNIPAVFKLKPPPGARFSKVPVINGPGKLSPFSLKIEVSVVLHVT